MKYTITGRTGRAQLSVSDMTGEHVPERRRREKPEFCVRLLPKNANPSTSYASAGDQVYDGPDLEVALMHIKAWTSLDDVPLPDEMKKYLGEAH